MTTVRDETFRLLRALKLTTIFGNPGSTEEPFLQDLPPDFTYVLSLQEASAVAMADGYAQATGRPALVNLHTAPGVGNSLGNVVNAWYGKTPLIVTAGQQTREMLLLEPWLTNRQATELPKPYVKWSYEPPRAQDVPGSLMRAYAAALQPPGGPVFLSWPMDDWDKETSGETAVRQVSHRVAPDPEGLRQIADALAGSVNPALIVGAGLDRSGGWGDAVALAERLHCPVYLAPASERAGFPEDHPQFQGGLPFAIGPLAEKLSGHDIALVVGAPVFRYYPHVPGPYLPAGTRLFHITDDMDEAARAPVGDSVLGDPALACASLAALVPQSGRALPAPRPAMPEPEAQTPMAPDFVFHALAQARPDDAVIVQESPSNMMAFHKRVPTTRTGSYFSMASGGLGWGLPASVGMALAERDTGRNRRVVAVIGDGSLQYSIQALWTAVQHRLPLLILAIKNEEYAILKSFAELEKTPNVPALDVPALDSVALARAYGLTAQRVEAPEDLAGALRAGLTADGPTLLEVVITPKVPPLLG